MQEDWKIKCWKRSMYIHISGWHTVDFGTSSSLITTRWSRGRSGWRHRLFWWRCTPTFEPLACLRIICFTILARKAAVNLIFLNHCQVSFYRSLYLFMPRKLNSVLLLFSEFGARHLDRLLRFLHCGMQKPSLGHLGHIQGKAHVGLF